MSISKKYIMTINKNKSELNKQLTISTEDSGIDVCFKILNNENLSLLENDNLLFKIIIKSPLDKQFESKLMPVINNMVIFTLTDDIMRFVTEDGIYKLYIILCDDKFNKVVLPPLDLIIVKNDIEITDVTTSSINSIINNVKALSSAENLNLYNVDGSYNRTLWSNDTIITSKKMNKIEEVISNLRDDTVEAKKKILELDGDNKILILTGKQDSPIIISQLDKGFYIIDGYIQNFSTDTAFEIKNTNYFIVTGGDTEYKMILRCLSTETYFRRLKYNITLATIENADSILDVAKVENGYVSITDSKYQYITTNEACTVLLPDVDNFIDITVLVYITDDVAITFPTIKWSTVPNISKNTLTKIKLTYVGDTWYGDSWIYE